MSLLSSKVIIGALGLSSLFFIPYGSISSAFAGGAIKESSEQSSKVVIPEPPKRPRYLIGVKGGDGTSFSVNAEQFLNQKPDSSQSVKFDKVDMKFGGKTLKKRDMLCSPYGDGNYYVMRSNGVPKRGQRETYNVDGWEGAPIIKCEYHVARDPKVKKVKLEFKYAGTYVDTIELETCIFTKSKRKNEPNKWDLLLSCKPNLHHLTPWAHSVIKEEEFFEV